VCQENFRVRFREIGEDALIIEVYAHLETRVWVEYLELVEELNFKFLDIVTEAGTGLALPARQLHIDQGAEPGQ
jgi:hypothetical protein